MSNQIILKKSSVGAKVPLATDLAYGELALNYADGKLYFKNSSNQISSFSASAVDLSAYVSLAGTQTLTNKTLTSPIVTGGTIDNTVIGATTPAAGTFTTLIGGSGSANYVQVTGAATGGNPTISSQGSDANARLILNAKGSSSGIDLLMNNARQMFIGTNGSAVNYFQTGGTASGIGLALQAQGSDTNISQVFQSKGTGAIDLAAGSSGVNISNGGTVTAITRTALGTAYTSPPSVVISAPTTAGGVQATATVPLQQISPLTIVSGGTGYTVGDTLTVSGGTWTITPTMTVATVSGGVITSINQVNYGVGTVIPSNPISVTGGTGTGATFSTTAWGIGAIFTITNAGSGYVEQPTVSFSGGGGSGAAAYAVVGSFTTIKSIGTGSTTISSASMVFSTPNGTALTLRDIGGADTGVLVSPQSGYVQFMALGATNAHLMLASAGTNSIYFNTQGTSQTNQMRVSHTASAVNYVQVTGAATGGYPTISSQGSDTNTGLYFQAKGTTGSLRFSTNGANSNEQFRVSNTASAVNYLNATGAAAGASPVFSVAGSDTNIDLTLTPKGATGRVNITSDLVVSGNLTVNGTTTTVNSTTISVDDKNIELGSIATPTDITADGGGITLKGTTDKTFNWVDATDAWTSSENLNLDSGKTYKINGSDVLTPTRVLGKTLPSGDILGTSDSQTLTNKTLNSTVLTGTLTAGGGVGTNGQVLKSTGTGVQWASASGGALSNLSDVAVNAPTAQQVLKYNGSQWVNANNDAAVASAVFSAQAQSDLGSVTDLVIGISENLGVINDLAYFVYDMGQLRLDGIVSLSNLDQSVKSDYIAYAIIFGF